MIAVGCLALVVLPLIGLVLGALLAGPDGAIWGALTGLAIAVGISGIMGYALLQIGRR
ncbi:hypothetical protein [Sphingomonas sp. 3-13AW]|jgi:hypothetical protein|uniref:hypothetical protein n=1 Tax=Sphingomonas sp. 3-13AW TaxID=3050450 RepID=UPI003BB651DE